MGEPVDAKPRAKFISAGADSPPPAPCVKISDAGADLGGWLRRHGIGFEPEGTS